MIGITGITGRGPDNAWKGFNTGTTPFGGNSGGAQLGTHGFHELRGGRAKDKTYCSLLPGRVDPVVQGNAGMNGCSDMLTDPCLSKTAEGAGWSDHSDFRSGKHRAMNCSETKLIDPAQGYGGVNGDTDSLKPL